MNGFDRHFVPAALLDSTFYFISWLSSVIVIRGTTRRVGPIFELDFLSIFFLNSIAVSKVHLDRWSPLALVL